MQSPYNKEESLVGIFGLNRCADRSENGQATLRVIRNLRLRNAVELHRYHALFIVSASFGDDAVKLDVV